MLKPEGPEYMIQHTQLMMADQESASQRQVSTLSSRLSKLLCSEVVLNWYRGARLYRASWNLQLIRRLPPLSNQSILTLGLSLGTRMRHRDTLPHKQSHLYCATSITTKPQDFWSQSFLTSCQKTCTPLPGLMPGYPLPPRHDQEQKCYCGCWNRWRTAHCGWRGCWSTVLSLVL